MIEKLNIPDYIIAQVDLDFPNDSLERKYCILKKWMQRTGVCKRYCCFHALISLLRAALVVWLVCMLGARANFICKNFDCFKLTALFLNGIV